MWYVFFFIGLIFLFLGIKELKFHKRGGFVKPVSSNIKNNRSTKERKIIPLNLEEVEIKENQEMTIQKELPSSPPQISSTTQEERKRQWEEYWIVKKVKERFEKEKMQKNQTQQLKEENIFYQSPQYEDESNTSQNDKSNVFQSLLENRQTAQQEETISVNEIQTPLLKEGSASLQEADKKEPQQEKPTPENTPLDGKEENQERKKEEEEEKEFNPFDMFK